MTNQPDSRLQFVHHKEYHEALHPFRCFGEPLHSLAVGGDQRSRGRLVKPFVAQSKWSMCIDYLARRLYPSFLTWHAPRIASGNQTKTANTASTPRTVLPIGARKHFQKRGEIFNI